MSDKDKKPTVKAQVDEIRKELDELIGFDAEPIEKVVETDPVLPVKNEDYVPLPSFPELKNKSAKQAKRTISALMKFYLDEEIIEKDEYIAAKKKMDEMTMASLVYQLQAGERALTTLLETIEDGELAPRMFEVLATLQKSMLDIIKSQTMYLMATEESTKRIAKDIEVYKKRETDREIAETGASTEDGTVQRGTKDLMRAIQQGIASTSEDDIEDVEETKE